MYLYADFTKLIMEKVKKIKLRDITRARNIHVILRSYRNDQNR